MVHGFFVGTLQPWLKSYKRGQVEDVDDLCRGEEESPQIGLIARKISRVKPLKSPNSGNLGHLYMIFLVNSIYILTNIILIFCLPLKSTLLFFFPLYLYEFHPSWIDFLDPFLVDEYETRETERAEETTVPRSKVGLHDRIIWNNFTKKSVSVGENLCPVNEGMRVVEGDDVSLSPVKRKKSNFHG